LLNVDGEEDEENLTFLN